MKKKLIILFVLILCVGIVCCMCACDETEEENNTDNENTAFTVTWKVEGTAVETDTEVTKGTKPSFDGTAPTKTATAQYTYAFAGWALSEGQETGSVVADLAEITESVTLYAAFSKTTNSYNIKWAITEENVLETDENVLYGATPSFDGEEAPTRENTAQYEYGDFVGWATQPDQETGVPASELSVTGNATYYAVFNKTVKCYNVWWSIYTTNTTQVIKSYHSSKGTAVPYGTSPIPYVDEEPVKAPTIDYAYTFVGWSRDVTDSIQGRNYLAYEDLPPVTGSVTYYATFTKSARPYTVVWKSQDGSVEYERDENVLYDTWMSFDQPNPTKEGYTFKGWSMFTDSETAYAATYVNQINASNATNGVIYMYAAFEPNEE